MPAGNATVSIYREQRWGFLLPVAYAAEVPITATSERPLSAPEEQEPGFELLLCFVSLFVPLNLLIGFAVFFLIAPVRRSDAFLASVSELQALVAEPRPD